MNEGMRRYLDSLPEGSVKHFTVENCPALAEYDRQMREETIPAIERAMKASRRAAHFACLGIPDHLASADTRRNGEDAVKLAAEFTSGAVANGETPKVQRHD